MNDAAAEPERRLLTIMFTDIVSSTAQLARIGDQAWDALLAQHNRIVRARLADHRGREIKTTGDGFLAVFDLPSQAIGCALAARRDIGRILLEIRVGLHTGEIATPAHDIEGIAAHIAARIIALARPGEILVSEAVYEVTAGSALRFTDRGRHEIRGVPERLRLYAVAERAPLCPGPAATEQCDNPACRRGGCQGRLPESTGS